MAGVKVLITGSTEATARIGIALQKEKGITIMTNEEVQQEQKQREKTRIMESIQLRVDQLANVEVISGTLVLAVFKRHSTKYDRNCLLSNVLE